MGFHGSRMGLLRAHQLVTRTREGMSHTDLLSGLHTSAPLAPSRYDMHDMHDMQLAVETVHT